MLHIYSCVHAWDVSEKPDPSTPCMPAILTQSMAPGVSPPRFPVGSVNPVRPSVAGFASGVAYDFVLLLRALDGRSDG